MLQWKDGRFHALGISFAIPDGFFLESEQETTHENGLSAWTPDMRCRVDWRIDEYDVSPYDGLNRLFSPNSGLNPQGGIERISVNGLSGFSALYETETAQFLEARLEAGEGGQLIVIIQDHKKDIVSLIRSKEIQAVLSGLQAD